MHSPAPMSPISIAHGYKAAPLMTLVLSLTAGCSGSSSGDTGQTNAQGPIGQASPGAPNESVDPPVGTGGTPSTGGSSNESPPAPGDVGSGGTVANGSGGTAGDNSTIDVNKTYADPNGTIIYADQPTMPQINAAKPGDTLLFEPGEHDRIDVDDFVSTECAPLVLASLDPKNPALIKNTTNPGWEALGVEGSSYVVIEDLIIEGGLSGIRVASSDHVIVLRNEIRLTNHSGFSVNSNSSYVDFIGNTIHDTGQSEPKWGEGIYLGTAAAKDENDTTTYVWLEENEIYETGYGEAIDMKGGVRFSTFRNNHVHDIKLGIENGQTNEAAIVMGYDSVEPAHNWVEYNLVENVSWGGGGEDARPNVGASGIAAFGGGNYLHHNTVRNCLEYGIFFHGYGDPGYFVYEWENDVSGSGYEDYHDGGLKNLMRQDPGITNPNSPQSWCAQ